MSTDAITTTAAASADVTPTAGTVPPLEYASLTTPARPINPWLFVPVLYFMQALPNVMVLETFGTAYKNLGVDNLKIVLWTGLAALPWVFKMFWAPLVDLSGTKRRWTIVMQFSLTAALLAAALAMKTSLFFQFSVAALFLIAILSATHDIACDGLYLMSLDRTRQASFSGVMATCSRLGRLTAASLVVLLAGRLINGHGIEHQTAWTIAIGAAAVAYGAGAIWNLFALPRPTADRPAADVAPGERSRNIVRTLTVVAFGVAMYYLINGSLQLIAHGIAQHVPAGKVPKNWTLVVNDRVNEITQQWVKIGAGLVLAPVLAFITRAQLRGTTMGEAFSTYVRQPGFGAIFGFIVFYRFGEAMIFAMAKLFFLDARDKGGMGLSLEGLGSVRGTSETGGLILGGLLGGWFISRVGLRRAFWPLVVCMHVPNLLYIWISHRQPDAAWAYPVVFAEAFGYGFGFAGYFVYLMHVAQRGKFVTSHYAIGTGLGALFITFATILAGIVQSVFGYVGVFVAACLFTIPGTLTLLFIPLDESQGRGIRAASDH